MIQIKKVIEEKISKEIIPFLTSSLEFRYQLLDHLISDIETYIETGNERKLWNLNAIEHADNIIALYNSFSAKEKPKWVTSKEIQNYVDILHKKNLDENIIKENVAEIILQQLGGNKFIAMIGAKNLLRGQDLDGSEYLSFKLSKKYNNINYIKIIYNRGRDDYTMEFGQISGMKYKSLYVIDTVYAEDLQAIFTDKTGLDTHL